MPTSAQQDVELGCPSIYRCDSIRSPQSRESTHNDLSQVVTIMRKARVRFDVCKHFLSELSYHKYACNIDGIREGEARNLPAA